MSRTQFPRLLPAVTMSIALMIALVAPRSAIALYVRPELENVPVERLAENLSKQAEAKPDDASIRFNLARLHAMAYAKKSDTAQVINGRFDGGAWFGYEPRHVPFENVPTDDPKRLKAAKAHLEMAIQHYEKVLKLDPNHLSARLGYAWSLDEAGRDMQAVDQYHTTIEVAWKEEKDMDRAPLGWHSIVAEAVSYLLPHLDKEADKEEIDQLQARAAQTRRIPRPITPIAIPLCDGLTAEDIHDRAAAVLFDADGSGQPKHWTWITSEAAWLVYDQRGTGQVSSALQLFGNVTFWLFWDNGYQALASLDDNADGQLTDDEMQDLALWHDANRNGRSEPGEIQPLSAHGITAISCRWENDPTYADRIPFSPAGVTFADGTSRNTYDIMLHNSAFP